MNKTERLEFLKKKRTEYKNRIELEKRLSDLNEFLFALNRIESGLVKIVSSEISIDNIVSPAIYDKPEKPIYTELRYKSTEEELNVKNVIKKWVLEQNSKKILIKNVLLIEKDDWLELNAELLLRNFDLLFDKLDILYTIMLVPENGNFINLFEFEYDVTFYKGKIKENEIKYYS
ncbi:MULTISPECIES: hypothetical protein [unclassified Flavobacterium]|uniref:hypothetical protein n=1 Tax=unclassified Flavobacterium TaxID=196869 RepID=UPI00129281EC|nr:MULTISPECIES: hypothetical protein [unclassified Flavobacterium]MQP53753.1 hypothetical protein [Flavobacterium sp. LMO9]MQP63638.1 hypothetical protein [Flavobacterium sp. LMO6]